MRVRVSAARRALRQAQSDLNSLLYASELAYGYALCGELNQRSPLEPAMNALGHVPGAAWRRGRNDRPHYEGRDLGRFLKDVGTAQTSVIRAVQVTWHADFEAYLDTRLGKRSAPWGPFAESLGSFPQLRGALWPLDLQKVLDADMWRVVRNEMVHRPRTVSGALNSKEGCDKLVGRLGPKLTGKNKDRWPGLWGLTGEQAKKYVLEAGERTVRAARDMAGKHEPPVEYFCCVFYFTAIDNLAQLIEEAMFDPTADKAEIKVRRSIVQRTEMISA